MAKLKRIFCEKYVVIVSVVCSLLATLLLYIRVDAENAYGIDSIITFCIFCTIIRYFLKIKNKSKSLWICSILIGVMFSFSYCMGNIIEHRQSIGNDGKTLLLNFLAVLAVALPVGSLSGSILNLLFCKEKRTCNAVDNEKCTDDTGKVSRRYFFIVWGCIFLLWIPYLLAYYPAAMSYDIIPQLEQVIYHDYTTHHPLIHTLLVGVLYKLGGHHRGNTIGMMMYSLVQMLTMSGIFAYTIYHFKKNGQARLFLIASFVFYAWFPVNALMSVTTTKDVLFSGLVLLATIFYENMLKNRKRIYDYALIICSVLMLMFRNNALYAWLALFLPVLIVFYKKWKKALIYLTVVAFVAVGANYGLKIITSAQSGSNIEMMSVPLQQMARVYMLYKDDMSKEELNYMYTYIPEQTAERYNAHLADYIKQSCNKDVILADMSGFIKCWGYFGFKYPVAYIDAFLYNSEGYWNINDTSHAQIYGSGANVGYGYMSTGTWSLEDPSYRVYIRTYLPRMREFIGKLINDNDYQIIPIFSIMFAPAIYVGILLFYTIYCGYCRKYKLLIPALFLCLYVMTLFLGPAALMRYSYPIMLCAPIMISHMISDGDKSIF